MTRHGGECNATWWAAQCDTAGGAMRRDRQRNMTWQGVRCNTAGSATRHSRQHNVTWQAAQRNVGTATPWHSSACHPISPDYHFHFLALQITTGPRALPRIPTQIYACPLTRTCHACPDVHTPHASVARTNTWVPVPAPVRTDTREREYGFHVGVGAGDVMLTFRLLLVRYVSCPSSGFFNSHTERFQSSNYTWIGMTLPLVDSGGWH